MTAVNRATSARDFEIFESATTTRAVALATGSARHEPSDSSPRAREGLVDAMLLRANLGELGDDYFRLSSVQSNFSGHGNRSPFVLLRLRKFRGTPSRNRSGKRLVRVCAPHT